MFQQRHKSLVAFSVALTATVVLFAQNQTPKSDKSRMVDFVQREKTAPAQIRSRLAGLRAQIQEKHLSFQIGYTSALDRPLAVLAGTRLPENLPALAEKQNAVAKDLLEVDTTARDAFAKEHPNVLPETTLLRKFVAPCSLRPSFDWRRLGKVTPVRDQRQCGSCWDFSALGAYEGSYLIRNNISIEGSEQQILSCSKAGSCSGGWPSGVFQYLISTGTATAASNPYAATDAPCNTSLPLPYRAVAWGYVASDGGIPSVAAMKAALCRYGPLSVTVYVDELFQAYTSGVFKDISSASSPGINHAITLIGWDDSKNAWLIKNSWGVWWGETGGYGTERGYMWIDYNSNKIGTAAAWVQAKNRFFILPPRYYEIMPNIRPMPEAAALKKTP